MTFYIDTSVLGAYYCPGPSSDAAEAALRDIDEPVISGLSEVEFGSLISKKRRLGELNEAQAGEILGIFDSHVADGFYRRVILAPEHYAKARRMITSDATALHTLDSLHLAVALDESLPLLTADKQLAVAATRHGCEVTLICRT